MIINLINVLSCVTTILSIVRMSVYYQTECNLSVYYHDYSLLCPISLPSLPGLVELRFTGKMYAETRLFWISKSCKSWTRVILDLVDHLF